jgi:ribose transport system ATP-binding protein
MSASPWFEFDQIEKGFFGIPVLRQVSFSIGKGETIGLVGENGAGKSTLMNILGGNLQADQGRMILDGQPYLPANPAAAEAHGVAFIHQELNLFPNLTIAENLFITALPHRSGLLSPLMDRAQLWHQAEELLRQVGLELPPNTLVEQLSAGERQLVEIARALSLKARLVIFDEPTTSLTTRESLRLFELIRQLQAQGVALIYISHHLAEIQKLCHSVVVLRDGAVAGKGAIAEFSTDRMVSVMVGRSLQQLYPTRTKTATAEPVLEAQGVSQPGIVRDIQLTVHRQEVLGVAGLMGAGRSELARILFGLDEHARGRIRLKGQDITGTTARDRLRRGMAFLTENRRDEGLCLEASIGDNASLVSLPNYSRPWNGWLRLGELAEAMRQICQAVRLSANAKVEQPVKTLSGGNQQKVVLAKWLLNKPDVFILDEPTRGIDVGARFEVYQLIHELADGGAGVLVISSEIEELMGLCDRILVMNQGEIRDSMSRHEFDRERILRAALGAQPPLSDGKEGSPA